MTLLPEVKPRKVDVVVVNDESDHPSLLNPLSGQIFVTNHVGKTVFELSDGERSFDQIVEEISRRFKGASKEVVGRDVAAFLEETVEKGLVTVAPGVPA